MHFHNKSMLLLILNIIFLAVDVTSLQITEIMFNPNGSDSGREWVEIYNNNSLPVNLSGMRFYESGANHLTNMIDGNSILHTEEYAVIVDQLDKFFNDYPDLEISNIAIFDSTFSLLNSGEYISIRIDDVELAMINYSVLLDETDINEGFSLSLLDTSWNPSTSLGGSPGFPNIVLNDNESYPNSTEDDNTCDINLDIETDKVIFENKESFKYKHRIANFRDDNKFNYTIEYWIEDIFNDTIKAKRNTTNVNKKTWTPSIEEQASVFLLKAIVYPECNDTNFTNNYAEKMIAVRNNLDTDSNSSDITEDSCNISLMIFADTLVNNSQTIKYKHYLNTLDYNFTIEYWIDDIFGNNIRQGRNTTNTNKKSFTPNIDEKEKSFVLKAVVYSECNDTDTADNYAEKVVVVKNLDYKEVEEECAAETDSRTETRKPQLEYYILDLPQHIKKNSILTFNARIINNDDALHELNVYSYVYRGSKCISGDGNRTVNKINFVMKPETDVFFEMNNTISDAEPGEYKVKLVINKDNQKTDKYLIKYINVTSDEDNSCVSDKPCNCSISMQAELLNNMPVYSDDISAIIVQPGSSRIVYEAKDMLIKDSIGNFVIAFMAVCMIFMIFGRGLG